MSAGVILIVVLLVLMVLGVPVFFCISLSSTAMFLATGLRSINAIVQKAVTGMDSFVLLAVPLFTLAGYIMETGGLSRRLVNWIEKIFGRVTGAVGKQDLASGPLLEKARAAFDETDGEVIV